MDITIEQAINRLKIAMTDDDYAYGWHANIAMCCADAMAEVKGRLPMNSTSDFIVAGNEGASRFMKSLFGKETSRHMLEENNG